MKTIVIYRSKYGYTKNYAQWIKEALQCELAEGAAVSPEDLQRYDTIIYGGGLYAVGIHGVRLLTGNYAALQGKNIIVWATGSNPGRQEDLEQVWAHNFTPEQREHIKTFYLRGGFDYTRLRGGDKLLMNMMKIKLEHTKNRTEDEEGLLRAYGLAENHCDPAAIKPLVHYVRALAGQAPEGENG